MYMYRLCVCVWDKTSFVFHSVAHLLWHHSSVEGHEIDLTTTGGSDARKKHLCKKERGEGRGGEGRERGEGERRGRGGEGRGGEGRGGEGRRGEGREGRGGEGRRGEERGGEGGEGRRGEGRGGREEEDADGEIGIGKDKKRQKRSEKVKKGQFYRTGDVDVNVAKRRGEDNELQWTTIVSQVAGHCTQDQN